jgi:hypothetical protein
MMILLLEARSLLSLHVYLLLAKRLRKTLLLLLLLPALK